jgi:DNA-binding NtrC family response regulator
VTQGYLEISGAPGAVRRPHVVVVDDEEIVGQAVMRALTRGGFEVESFVHGKNALVRIAESDVVVVVSDIVMRMTGMSSDCRRTARSNSMPS